MALIGHLTQFKGFFHSYPSLSLVQDYLTQALQQDSVIHTRIMALEGKVEMNYDIGNHIRAIEQTYPLKPKNEAFYETHKKFIDFQLCISGAESFEIGYIEDFSILESYDEHKDLIIYHKPTKPLHTLYFSAGTLGIFFPEDVHAGGLAFDGLEYGLSQPKKVVLKVPLELFTQNY